jgi:hypothetical protein
LRAALSRAVMRVMPNSERHSSRHSISRNSKEGSHDEAEVLVCSRRDPDCLRRGITPVFGTGPMDLKFKGQRFLRIQKSPAGAGLFVGLRQPPLTTECDRAVYARIGLADLSAARSVGRPGLQAWRSYLLPQH